MGIKLGLVKSVIIDSFIILLTCMNFVHAFLTLFLNRRRLLCWITDILAMSATTSSYSTGSSIYPFLLSSNFINLNLLWVDWILDLDQEKVLHTFLEITFTISTSSPISALIILPNLLVHRISFPMEQVIFIYFNTCSVNGIVVLRMMAKKLFAWYGHRIVCCAVLYCTLYVERCLVIL